MNLSIILCSRERPEMLSALINDIFTKAWLPEYVEVRIGTDSDDMATYQAIADFVAKGYKVYMYSRDRDRNLHTYLNKMAKECKGDFIWVLNDDCRISDHRYDETIVSQMATYLADKPDGIAYGLIHCNSADKIGNYSSFPVISKKAVEVLGFFMHEQIKTWGADCKAFEVYDAINRVCDIKNFEVNHALHSVEGIKEHNSLRDDTLKWYRDNNKDPLEDMRSVDTTKDIMKLGWYIMRENNLSTLVTKRGILTTTVSS